MMRGGSESFTIVNTEFIELTFYFLHDQRTPVQVTRYTGYYSLRLFLVHLQFHKHLYLPYNRLYYVRL